MPHRKKTAPRVVMEPANKPSGQPTAPGRSLLPKLLIAFGIWGIFAPYLAEAIGYGVPVAPVVEVVDHVVPGIIILLVAVILLRSPALPLIPALAAVLAAFWMVATHVSLVLSALRGFPSMAAALFHSVPGAVLLVLTALLAVRAYKEAPD